MMIELTKNGRLDGTDGYLIAGVRVAIIHGAVDREVADRAFSGR
jgi:hypothetical protein